jgi:hypothetical protein
LCVTHEGLRNEYRIVEVREYRAPLQPALIRAPPE